LREKHLEINMIRTDYKKDLKARFQQV
jgi:hypothetical protein